MISEIDEFKKDLDYYMSLPYEIEMRPVYENGKAQYAVTYPDFPGCVAYGDTQIDAMKAADKLKKNVLEAALKSRPHLIPEPLYYYFPRSFDDIVSEREIVRECKRTVLMNMPEEAFRDERFKNDVYGLICCARILGDMMSKRPYASSRFLDDPEEKDDCEDKKRLRFYCDRFPLLKMGLWMADEFHDRAVLAEVFSTRIIMHQNIKDQYIILLIMRLVLLVSHGIHGWDICRALCGMLPDSLLKDALDNKDDMFGKDPRPTKEEIDALLDRMNED